MSLHPLTKVKIRMLMPVVIEVAKDVVNFQGPGKGQKTEKRGRNHDGDEGSTARMRDNTSRTQHDLGEHPSKRTDGLSIIANDWQLAFRSS